MVHLSLRCSPPPFKRSVTYTDSDGTIVSESISKYGDTCTGHAGSDVFPFGLLDTDTDGFEVSDPYIDACLMTIVPGHSRLWNKEAVSTKPSTIVHAPCGFHLGVKDNS